MRRGSIAAATLAAGICTGALLGGCGGSGTTTVDQSTPPPAGRPETQAASSTPTTTATSTPSTTPTTPAASTGGTGAPSGTRTAPEPAFAQQEAAAEGVSSAAALVRSKGYTPDNTSEYHPNQTLRVLIGTQTGSTDGYGQQAFFFVDGRFIGTDTKQPSATVKVLGQGDTAVTLAYPLYRSGDPLGNPSGGQRIVRFELNDGKLTPVGAIPPASSASGLSRNSPGRRERLW